MKNTYKFSFLFLLIGLLFSSCALDDDPAVVSNTVTGNVIQFAQSGTINYPSGSDLVVNMSSASSTNSQVNYTVTQTATDGTVSTLSEGVLAFSAGATSGIINVDVPFLETVTVTLSNPIGINNPNISVGTNSTLMLIGGLAASPTSIELALTHEGSNGDIWFGLSQFTNTGNWIVDYHQNSTGILPRFMSIPLDGAGNLRTIPNTADVDPNIIALNLYTQATLNTDPFGYKIYITMPDGSAQEFEGTIPAMRFVDNAVVRVVVADDAANPGQKTYTFSAL